MSSLNLSASVVGGIQSSLQGTAFGAFQRFVTTGKWDSAASAALAQQFAVSVVSAIPIVGTVFSVGMAIGNMMDDGLPTWGERREDVDRALRLGVTPAALHDMRVYVHQDGNPQTTPMNHLASLVGRMRDVEGITYPWDGYSLLPGRTSGGITPASVVETKRQSKKRVKELVPYAPHVDYAFGYLAAAQALSKGSNLRVGKTYELDNGQLHVADYHVRDSGSSLHRGYGHAGTVLDAYAGMCDAMRDWRAGLLRPLRDATPAEVAAADDFETVARFAELSGMSFDAARGLASGVDIPRAPDPVAISRAKEEGKPVPVEQKSVSAKSAVLALVALMASRGL